MKKSLCCIIAVLLLTASVACGGSASARTGSQTITVNDVLAAGIAEASAAPTETTGQPSASEPDETTPAQNTGAWTSGIDVDLTVLSSTMVYSEVYNMMTAPEDYLGKTVKMDGAFAYYRDEATGNEYFACIVQDATACCAQGIEFVLNGTHSFPDDYPPEGDFITVVGVFDTYWEGEYRYCTLRSAVML